ncbi:transposable element Tcb1 transposase [Trichonephila clavipes]|nr:transposable element Tcb1 transposase [Trichonephila clavipes]
MINGRTRLHVVANGTMTGQRYINEVLLPHVRLFRGAVGDNFVFMDDNATCHRTLVVQDCLDSEGIQRLVWPARSPDLNPIENVWDALGRQVAGRNYPPITRTPSSVNSQRNGINCLNSCWIMLCKAGRRAVLLARWIVQSLPLEIVESSGHEKDIHAGKTGSGAARKITRREDRRIVRQAIVEPTVILSMIRTDIVFSDESRFVLGTDDNRVRVWRRPGERYNSTPSQIVLRHTLRTDGVMVWGGIAYVSPSTLNVMHGTLTGQSYVDDILRPHVGPFLNGLLGAIFHQDNARPQTARVGQNFLRHFQTLPWPAHSPDLSPVEHVEDQLKRQMPSCHSVHDLELAV